MVQAGTFREDLYYRLRGASIAVPPLRDRIADLELLIAHFMAEVNSNLRITREAWRVLVAYSWPGNVRELRAEVQRWHVFCDRWVRPEDLDALIVATPTALQPILPVDVHELATVVTNAERHAIRAALTKAEQNLSRAATLLGIDRNTLKRKIRTLAIEHTRLPAGRPE